MRPIVLVPLSTIAEVIAISIIVLIPVAALVTPGAMLALEAAALLSPVLAYVPLGAAAGRGSVSAPLRTRVVPALLLAFLVADALLVGGPFFGRALQTTWVTFVGLTLIVHVAWLCVVAIVAISAQSPPRATSLGGA